MSENSIKYWISQLICPIWIYKSTGVNTLCSYNNFCVYKTVHQNSYEDFCEAVRKQSEVQVHGMYKRKNTL